MTTNLDASGLAFTRLRWTIQALAAPAEVQCQLYPDFTAKPDELALDFGDAFAAALAFDLTEPQGQALKALAAKLSAMSRSGADFTDELWSEAALGASEHWSVVRALARSVLDAFGWRSEPPPLDPASRGVSYIPG
jgi:hypothetical protein